MIVLCLEEITTTDDYCKARTLQQLTRHKRSIVNLIASNPWVHDLKLVWYPFNVVPHVIFLLKALAEIMASPTCVDTKNFAAALGCHSAM